MKKIAALDLGGSSIKFGLYNENGDVLQNGGENTINKDSLQSVLDDIDNIVRCFDGVDAVGISVPGIVDGKTSIISIGGAIEVLDKVDLRDILSQKYGLPVAVENDANCAALAEYWMGSAVGCKNVVCITIGTGIGGAIIIDGKLHRGSHNFSGEFGLMINPSNTLENFGYTATSRLLNRASDIDANIKTGQDFFDMLNNIKMKHIYDDWITRLAVGIYNIAMVIDPDKLLLGGGISVQARIYTDIDDIIKKIANYPYSWRVQRCTFGNDAGKLGAVYKLLEEYGELWKL